VYLWDFTQHDVCKFKMVYTESEITTPENVPTNLTSTLIIGVCV
jgi:hypothetical protein